MEARLGRLILTGAALDDLTGAAWDTMDEWLSFRVARVAALAEAGHERQPTRSALCAEGPARQAVRALPCHPLLRVLHVWLAQPEDSAACGLSTPMLTSTITTMPRITR